MEGIAVATMPLTSTGRNRLRCMIEYLQDPSAVRGVLKQLVVMIMISSIFGLDVARPGRSLVWFFSGVSHPRSTAGLASVVGSHLGV
jgi:hypothetical protein